MILNTRVTFKHRSTLARFDKNRGYVFISGDDTAPSIGDELTHDGESYEVIAVDRLDHTASARRIQVRTRKPVQVDEPLADWERELLYGTTGPMPTKDIIRKTLGRTEGFDLLRSFGAAHERRLKKLLGHAIVLAKQEMNEYHKRQAAKAAEGEAKVELGEASVGVLSKAFASGVTAAAEREAAKAIVPQVPEGSQRPSVEATLEALTHYVDSGAWDGRFERIVRTYRKPITPQGALARGGFVHGGAVPVGTSIHGLRGGL